MFIVFFAILYALLTYGLMFAAQQSLNLAAQEGARRMLRVQANDSVSQRLTHATALARQHTEWISNVGGTPVTFTLCMKTPVAGGCQNDALLENQVEFVSSYAYGAFPLVPNLPLVSALILPQDAMIGARAVVQLGVSP